MVKKNEIIKPKKKTSVELFLEIDNSLKSGNYYFTDHGDRRSKTRKTVNDIEIIKILSGSDKWHEAVKDKYEKNRDDWNYHIRGKNTDGDQIRIVVSFDEDGMPIITVVNLDEEENE